MYPCLGHIQDTAISCCFPRPLDHSIISCQIPLHRSLNFFDCRFSIARIGLFHSYTIACVLVLAAASCWVYPFPLVLHLPSLAALHVHESGSGLPSCRLLLCCCVVSSRTSSRTFWSCRRASRATSGAIVHALHALTIVSLNQDDGRHDCFELECFNLLFNDAHIASPVPSPVHLYNDNVSRRRRCCSPPSSGIRPRTCASADCMTFRKARCDMIISTGFSPKNEKQD